MQKVLSEFDCQRYTLSCTPNVIKTIPFPPSLLQTTTVSLGKYFFASSHIAKIILIFRVMRALVTLLGDDEAAHSYSGGTGLQVTVSLYFLRYFCNQSIFESVSEIPLYMLV